MKIFLSFITLLFMAGFAHAQVGPCPPGMSQYPSPDGVPSCGPLRSESNQPHGHWVSQWGGLAIGENGTTGWSMGQPSEEIAKQAAMENCVFKGGTNCKISATYRNGCVAIVNGERLSYPSTDATRDEAIVDAIKSCKRSGETNCELVRAECSTAKWVND